MISVDEARKIIAEKTPSLGAEKVQLDDALGRVLREPVIADTDQPPFDRSAMDGYAIRADDKSETFKIITLIQAGDTPAVSLQPGECARIFTGAPIPPNGGIVIRQEDTLVADQVMRITERAAKTHIRKKGEEVKAGTILIQPGQLLRPVDLSVMAGVGHTQVSVSRKPRVLHLSSGNELVKPDQIPKPGQIRDSNSILIKSLVAQSGGEIAGHLHAGDHLEEILHAARSFPPAYDILLFSGGASVGDFDYAATTLEQLGFTIHFRQVSVRPGKPLIFATKDRQIAFGLPGNPVSHFVTFHLFVRAAIRKLQNLEPLEECHSAILSADQNELPNPRETYWPASFDHSISPSGLLPLQQESSGHLASLLRAEALIKIPANSAPMAKGQVVTFLPV